MVHAAITGRHYKTGNEILTGQCFKYDRTKAVKFGAVVSRCFQIRAAKIWDVPVQWHRTPAEARAAAEGDAYSQETTVVKLYEPLEA